MAIKNGISDGSIGEKLCRVVEDQLTLFDSKKIEMESTPDIRCKNIYGGTFRKFCKEEFFLKGLFSSTHYRS